MILPIHMLSCCMHINHILTKLSSKYSIFYNELKSEWKGYPTHSASSEPLITKSLSKKEQNCAQLLFWYRAINSYLNFITRMTSLLLQIKKIGELGFSFWINYMTKHRNQDYRATKYILCEFRCQNFWKPTI